MIDVLIVDDSLTAREFIKHIFAGDPEIRIIGEAKNGAEALCFVEKRRPDVVVMDIRMPGMNGYETTRAMMEICPVPIIIHSSLATPGQNDIVFQAMNAGAVAVSQKPSGPGHPESRQMAEKLIRTVKLMSEIKVVRKFKPRHRQARVPGPMAQTTGPRIEVIGIGASTGGPPVIQALLSSLSPRFRIPIIIVQHITAGFLSGMVSWLSKHTPMTLSVPHTGEAISEGHIYFAPEDHHLEVTPTRHFLVRPLALEIALKRPITHLFLSMAQVFGNTAAGVLLTGMGNDGALGLKEMKRHGAVTLVQNRETAVVFGMPHEAIKLDAATFVLSPPEIASYLNLLARNSLPLS
jgi:two-component system, chemotaxis family, protein-glutamate methylesterase/glutaminase